MTLLRVVLKLRLEVLPALELSDEDVKAVEAVLGGDGH